VLGERDLVEARALDTVGGELALRAAAVLETVEHGALLRGLAERGAARLELGVVAVEVQRGLLAGGAHAVHPGLRGDQVVSAALHAGGAAGRVLGRAHGQRGVLEHRLAAQPLAEACGELLLGELLVVLPELPEALQAEVSAVHLGRLVGRAPRGFSRWTDDGYARAVRRPLPLLIAAALLAGGCGKGTVTNDDDVSRDAAIQAVESFFDAVHDGRHDAACALLPGPQRGGLARLSASRHGPPTCAGALRTLREFALVRAPGRLTLGHDIRFRNPLPHKSKRAIDQPTVDGRTLGAVGLRRDGESWRVAFVCECP
jgi:hypothetical protein